MIIRPLFRRAAGIFLAALLCSLSDEARAAILPAENLLPSDTLFVLTVPDFSALRADAHQSPQWLFWNDPAMKPFHDKFIRGLNDNFIGPLEGDLGIKLADFEELPQGQLTFAITRNGWNGGNDKSPGFVFLLDAKDKRDLLATNIAALEKKWTDGGKTLRTETVRGIPFAVVMISSNDVPGSLTNLFCPAPQTRELGREPAVPKPHELVVGQFDSLLIVGNSLEAVDPVVAHLTGSGMPSLNDEAAFATDKMNQFHGSPLYYGWLDAKTLFGVLASTPPPAPNPQAPTVFPPMQSDKIIAALGLTSVKSASFSYYETHAGAQINFFIAVPESERKGIIKMFAPESKTAVPPVFVPADAVKFSRWRVDGRQGWQTLQDIIGSLSPAGMIGLNATIDMANANARQKNPGFDIRRDLFDNIGDDFMSYQKSPGSSAAGANSGPSLFLFGVENGDHAVAAISTLLSMSPSGQPAPPPRKFQGHTIYSLPLPGLRIGPAATPNSSFLYCTTSDGYVALTTDVSMLEGFLRSEANPPKPLSGRPGLVDAAQHVGGTSHGVFGYQNQREMLKALFQNVNAQTLISPGIASPLALLPKSFGGLIDFSLLPDFDAVSQYFNFSVYAASSTPDGISFKTFSPRPTQLN